MHARRRKSVTDSIVCGVYCDELPLKGGYKFRGLQTILLKRARNLVSIGLAFSATVEVKEAGIRARYLQPLVAEASCPLGDPRESIERGPVTRKLRDE